jgi:excisionase family DNA binding protein
MYLPPETLEFVPTVDLQSEPWVEIKEVAERLNTTIDMVLIWIRNCDLPAEKMGGVWYFKLSRVASWWNSIPKVISYNKLFKLLIDKDINKKEFVRISGMSSSTLWRLKNDGGPVKMEVIQKICDTLNCQPNDVCAFVPKDY